MTGHTTVFIRLVIGLALLAPCLALAAGVQALFDVNSPTGAPFPSDRFTVRDENQNTELRIDLPKPDCAVRVSECADIDVLNTLDGFNLQPRLSIPFSGPIDLTTVNSKTVVLVSLGSARHGRSRHHDEDDDDDDDDARKRDVRSIGINQIVWDVGTNTLHVESDELLDQHARYALIVTRGIRDANGQPVRASEDFEHFGHGHDYRLKAYRKALKKGLDRARAAGLHHRDIVAASVFTTQSITTVLEKIREQIQAATPEPADFLLGTGGTRTVYSLASINDFIFARHLRVNPDFIMSASMVAQLNFLKQTLPGSVGQLAFGKYRSPDYLSSCPPVPPPCNRFIPPVPTRTGAPEAQDSEEIYFNLFLPSGTRPPSGWPVVIFGLGSEDSKNLGPFRIASQMAAHGLAVIAINGVGQGLGPLSTLTLRLADGASVSFPAGGRSSDQNGDGLIGTGVFPTSEGLETLSQGSSISRRDPRRQTVVDHMQLVRVIEIGMDVDGDGAADLDASRIYYFGWSHGADYGTIFAATEPRVRAVVLNAVGGNIESFLISTVNRSAVGRYLERRVPPLLNAPGVVSLDGVPIGPPHFDENRPLRNQPPVVNPESGTVAMDIQRVIDNAQWLFQFNDGSVYSPYLRKHPLGGRPGTPVIVQFARGDQTIPNPATSALLRNGDLGDRATYFRNDLAFPANPTTLTKNPHPFAIRATPPPFIPLQIEIALQAQRQAAVFFASDGAETIDPDGPCVPGVSGCFFEEPIESGLLPEDLGFIP